MKRWAYRALLSSILGLSLIASACGSSGGGSPSITAKGPLTVAGFNFPESSILAQIYGQALGGAGWTVSYKLNLGTREVVEPALEKGDIDLYPGYAATELEFQNKGKDEASGDAAATTAKLNTYLQPRGLLALTPAAAVDGNAFAVTKATATKYNLSKLSDLAAAGSQLVLGGPPECPTRPFCQLGLQTRYGISFKSFKALDAGGPLTFAALDRGDIQVGLVFSSDSTITTKGLVVLQDDKHLENADNVVPVVRTKTVDSEAQRVLDGVSAKLTTDILVGLNKKADVDKADPDQIAAGWLKSQGIRT